MRARLYGAARLLGRVLAKSSRDEVGLRASALAFSTLLSAVPLLAAVSIFVARALREDEGRLIDLITELLPYREESVIAALKSFLEQTESVSGVAVLGFLVTSAVTFFGVQQSLFQIFRVENPPSLPRRLITFSMLFFWGPVVIGTAQTGLLFLAQSSPEAARLMRESLVLRAIPALVTFAGLTMLYWRAAFRRITLGEAAVGALVSAVLLEALKIVFGVYVREFTEVQLAVYGTFAIALFFVVSVHWAWYILLVGAELGAVLAADRKRARAGEPVRHEPDPWLGLAALEHLAAPGMPRLEPEILAARLGLDLGDLYDHLRPLREVGLLEGGLGYRLALPPHQIRLATVLAAYRRRLGDAPSPLPEQTRQLRIRLRHALEHDVGDETLADLVAGPDEEVADAEPGAGTDPAAPAELSQGLGQARR
jgi:membrane protein